MVYFPGDSACRSRGQRGWKCGSVAAGLGILALAGLCLFLGKDAAGPSPRGIGIRGRAVDRVILVIVDTLRPDALSCYRPGTSRTPHIDRLAADGVLFRNAFSTAPWTLPSVSSIMTGLPPTAHRAIRPDARLPDAVVTLAEYMRDAGYLTAAIGSNVFLGPDYNLSQGFLEYEFYPKMRGEGAAGPRGEDRSRSSPPPSDISTSILTAKTIAWLESHRDDRFFLWLHYFDPHQPYDPPSRHLPEARPPDRIGPRFGRIDEVRGGDLDLTVEEREWIRELYDAEVRHVDENVGLLVRALQRLGMYDGALIVLTSDHGEEFWEHGGYEHGHTLYSEVLRVPLIVKLPGGNAPASRSEVVSVQGVMPTVLDLCGIRCDERLAVHSLLPR